MKFQELPRGLKVYVTAQALVLIPFLVAVGAYPGQERPGFVAFLLLGMLTFSIWKVKLPVSKLPVGHLTATFAIECLALLMEGPRVAVLCSIGGALAGSLLRTESGSWRIRRIHWPAYKVAFNVANTALAGSLGSLLFAAINHPGGAVIPRLIGLAVFTLANFLINTVGVSGAIALQEGLPMREVWVNNFQFAAVGYYASASAALAIHWAFQQMGALALAFVPPLHLLYYWYRLYVDRVVLLTEKTEKELAHARDLNRVNQSVIASLATAIDAKDRDTCSHIQRVRMYAMALAKRAGLDGPELQAVETGALVHDIGKLGVPDHILLKPGKLSPEEFQRMQTHVDLGAEILSPVEFPYPVVDVVLTHHERWDGLGYPKGLKGEEIPMGGRIIGIVDVFDALTSNRPYRRALPLDQAVQVIREGAGKQFDPRLVELFIEVLPSVRAEIARMESEALSAGGADAAMVSSGALAQIGRAAAEVAAGVSVASAFAEHTSLEELCRRVTEHALAMVPADTAILYLVNPDTRMLTATAVQGRYEDKLQGMNIQLGEGAAGWVAERGQVRVNVSAALDIARRFNPEENMELSSVTAVPLTRGGETLGVLSLYTVAYRVLNEQHLPVLNILADHAAAAVQKLLRMDTAGLVREE